MAKVAMLALLTASIDDGSKERAPAAAIARQHRARWTAERLDAAQADIGEREQYAEEDRALLSTFDNPSLEASMLALSSLSFMTGLMKNQIVALLFDRYIEGNVEGVSDELRNTLRQLHEERKLDETFAELAAALGFVH